MKYVRNSSLLVCRTTIFFCSFCSCQTWYNIFYVSCSLTLMNCSQIVLFLCKYLVGCPIDIFKGILVLICGVFYLHRLCLSILLLQNSVSWKCIFTVLKT